MLPEKKEEYHQLYAVSIFLSVTISLISFFVIFISTLFFNIDSYFLIVPVVSFSQALYSASKDILIKNLDSCDKVEYHEIHYDFGSTLSFYNSNTNQIKSYSLNCKTFTISQYINEAYQDGKFKEYDRSLFVENLDLNDDD